LRLPTACVIRPVGDVGSIGVRAVYRCSVGCIAPHCCTIVAAETAIGGGRSITRQFVLPRVHGRSVGISVGAKSRASRVDLRAAGNVVTRRVAQECSGTTRRQVRGIHGANLRTCVNRSGSGACHDGAILYGGWRRNDARPSVHFTEMALPRRGDADVVVYACAAQRCLGDVHGVAINALTVDEIVARSHGDRASVVRVRVVVIAVADDGGVVDHGVANVDALDITASSAEPWMVGLTKTEREPAHASAEPNSDAEV
jgi:hypothetical protein